MIKKLILDNEENTELDLTGVTSFDVIGHPGSIQWTVRAIIDTIARELITYSSWKQAQLACRALTKHVIDEDVDIVVVHSDTGSIVPQ